MNIHSVPLSSLKTTQNDRISVTLRRQTFTLSVMNLYFLLGGGGGVKISGKSSVHALRVLESSQNIYRSFLRRNFGNIQTSNRIPRQDIPFPARLFTHCTLKKFGKILPKSYTTCGYVCLRQTFGQTLPLS